MKSEKIFKSLSRILVCAVVCLATTGCMGGGGAGDSAGESGSDSAGAMGAGVQELPGPEIGGMKAGMLTGPGGIPLGIPVLIKKEKAKTEAAEEPVAPKKPSEGSSVPSDPTKDPDKANPDCEDGGGDRVDSEETVVVKETTDTSTEETTEGLIEKE